jgi:hypothetical protein
MAAKSAEQGTMMGILNCFFYPWLVPIMRNQARIKRGIDVRFLLNIIYTEFNNYSF